MIRALVLALLVACGSDPPPPTEGEQAKARIEQLQKDLGALDERIGAASRADAKDLLARLRRDRTQLEQQLAQAKLALCTAGSGC